MNDILGKEIVTGSRVAYAALNYKAARLRTGEVVGIDVNVAANNKTSVRIKSDYDKVRRWFKPENLVVIG